MRFASGHVARDHRGPLDVIPPLCVGVVSNDRVTQRGIDATAGVQELWTIVREGIGLFERWTGAHLMTREEIRGTLASRRLPGFTLDLAELSGAVSQADRSLRPTSQNTPVTASTRPNVRKALPRPAAFAPESA